MTTPVGFVAVIIGCRGPVGEALCAGLAARGYRVVACGRTSPWPAGTVDFRQLDVTDEAAIGQLFYQLKREDIHPDVVVLNAARFSDRPVSMISAAHVDELFDVNVRGALLIAREAIKAFMRRGGTGRLVAVSSIAASRPAEGAPVYGMSKAALEHMVRALPAEVAGSSITVNAVEIAVFGGEGMAANLSGGVRERLLAGMAVRRPCQAEDLVHAVAFLASPESAYITGQILRLGFV